MHAGLDAAADRLIGIKMSRDVRSRHLRLLDDGFELAAREAEKMDRVGRRGAAAVRHDLDEIRAALDLFARRAANFVDPVANASERAQPMPRSRREPIIVAPAKIRVSAGLA